MNKKVFSALLLLISITMSCEQVQNDQVVVEGYLKGIADQKIILSANGEEVDTTTAIDGKFTFKRTIRPATALNLILEDKDYMILEGGKIQNPYQALLMADNGQHISVEIMVEDPDNPNRTHSGHIVPEVTIVNNSPAQLKVRELNAELDKAFSKRDEDNQKVFDKLNIDWSKEKPLEGRSQEELDVLEKARATSRKIYKDKEQFLVTTHKENTNNLKGLLAMIQLESRSMRNDSLLLAKGVSIENLSEDVKNSGLRVYYKNRKQQYQALLNAKASIKIGGNYKNFKAQDVDGNTVDFSSLVTEGNYVLLDFWASWCGPCRAENPNVLKQYNKYHDKGFDVVAYSLDKSKNSWIKAIKEDGMPWTQLSDLEGFKSNVVQDYGVFAIPDNVLIDGTTGKIMRTGLRGKWLDETLGKIFDDK